LFISTWAFSYSLDAKDSVQKVYLHSQFINEVLNWNIGVQVDVQELASGKFLGHFESDKKGHLILILPKSEAYQFFVTPDGSEITHYAVIKPPQVKSKQLFLDQKMTLQKDEQGEEILLIENFFSKSHRRKTRKKAKAISPQLFE